MTKWWEETIGVEYGEEGLGLFWYSPLQLKQSIVFIAVLLRELEGNPELTVGLREERIVSGENGPVYIHDLGRVRDDQVELVRTRYVQDAVVLLDGVRSDYRIRTDGVKHGLLEIDVPPERREVLEQRVDVVIATFAAEHDVRFRCSWQQ
jgi:hypothetical protein